MDGQEKEESQKARKHRKGEESKEAREEKGEERVLGGKEAHTESAALGGSSVEQESKEKVKGKQAKGRGGLMETGSRETLGAGQGLGEVAKLRAGRESCLG